MVFKSTSMVLFSFFLFAILVPLLLAASDESKLQVGIKKRGKCDRPSQTDDRIFVHYTGTLPDGTEFDSSVKRGTPFDFILGKRNVIQGWDQGLLGRCPGDKLKLKIPPHLGYGERGAPPTIPPNSHLIFEIEVMSFSPSERSSYDL